MQTDDEKSKKLEEFYNKKDDVTDEDDQFLYNKSQIGRSSNSLVGISDTPENQYLLLGFWEFAILSTLMVVFFPWSLLFCLLFFGLNETKLIILALLHDAAKTFLAVLAIVAGLVVITLIFISA